MSSPNGMTTEDHCHDNDGKPDTFPSRRHSARRISSSSSKNLGDAGDHMTKIELERHYQFHAFKEPTRFHDDHFQTLSSREQKQVEDLCAEQWRTFALNDLVFDRDELVLDRKAHVAFLLKSLKRLPASYQKWYGWQAWLAYWTVHSLRLLGQLIPEELCDQLISFLKLCEHPEGGYGGGPGQIPHLATTYAAVMALCELATEDAYKSINRDSLSVFLHAMKQSDGSFVMNRGGEADIRASYCALAVARLTGIADDALGDNAAEWVISCQSYEGGFGGCKYTEAHGGYTYCGLATLVLLGRSRLVDRDSLIRWLTQRQMGFEGGFQGRTNKLVDGCYSFWQAACFPLIRICEEQELAAAGSSPKQLKSVDLLFDTKALQEYVLICCQQENGRGGLKDKPGKHRDPYHTCYTLSGLSIAQYYFNDAEPDVIGDVRYNQLLPTHPVFNITLGNEQKAMNYFKDSHSKTT